MFEQSVMSGGKFLDALQERSVIRYIAPGKIILHGQWISLPPQQRVRQQAFQFRGEDQAAITQPGGEQRLHPHPVAGQKQLARFAVIQRKGEHAVQVIETFHTPFLPCCQNDFGVAFGFELGAHPRQFAAQFRKVVDLAIENDDRASIGRMHRLRGAVQVDDRQAARAEANAWRGPHTRAIRPAMNQCIAHPLDPVRINRLGRL